MIGWPAVIAAALIAITALAFKSHWLLLAAAIVGTPFGLYVLGSPVLWPAAAISLLSFHSATLALHRRRVLLAAFMVAPFFVLASFVVFRSWQAA